MRRRQFLGGLGGVLVSWPIIVRAQRIAPRVGYLYTGPKSLVASRIEAISTGLRESGLVAPVQVEFVVRTTDGDPTRIASMIGEIVASRVNLFIANGLEVTRTFRAVAPDIPIVAIDLETDPVGSDIAASLARPGGNITGIFMDFPDFTPKCLQMLAESNSGLLSRAAILWDPASGPVQMNAVRTAALTLKVELEVFEARRSSDFENAFSTTQQRGIGSMLILSSPLIPGNVQTLAELALHYRIAAITRFPDFARAGGLLAYGPNLSDLVRQLGVMSGKVLQGTKPAELPIERPSKFELVVNLKTAKALGLSISPGLLLRADEVIE
jgi:putative tryptophan/tyrosine transport system substrate-binding protein